MKAAISFGIMITLIITSVLYCQSPLPSTQTNRSSPPLQVKAAEAAWSAFLVQKVKDGQSESAIDRLMAGKYRDRAKFVRGGSGRYSVIYLVDDYLELEFPFSPDSKCTGLPAFAPATPWIRFPDGSIVHSEK